MAVGVFGLVVKDAHQTQFGCVDESKCLQLCAGWVVETLNDILSLAAEEEDRRVLTRRLLSIDRVALRVGGKRVSWVLELASKRMNSLTGISPMPFTRSAPKQLSHLAKQ